MVSETAVETAPDTGPNHEADKSAQTHMETPTQPGVPPAVNDAGERLTLQQLMPENWRSVYLGLAVGGVIQNTAANLVLLEKSGNQLRFQLDIDNSSLYEEAHSERLAKALTAYFGEPVEIQIDVGEVSAETPQATTLRLRAERQAAAVESMKNDENVQQIIARFDGRLLENTIKPLDKVKL